MLVSSSNRQSIKTHLVKDRDGETGVKMRIDKAGKEAISIFQAQVQGKHVSLLHIDIKTGRMHQIRVQRKS